MTPDEQAIRTRVSFWHTAIGAGDVDTVPGHPPMRGRSTFARGLRGLLAQHRIESTNDVQEIEVSGDLAYCWSNLTVRLVPLSGAAATVRTGSALSILRKRADDRWVVVRDANLLVVKA